MGAHAFAFLSFKRHHKNKLVNQGRSESAMGRRLHTMEGCWAKKQDVIPFRQGRMHKKLLPVPAEA